MGWVALMVVGLAAFGLLWWSGMRHALATLCGAALMFGAAGYAVQQQASLPGRAAKPGSQQFEVDPGMVTFRAAIMPQGPGEAEVLSHADDLLRGGNSKGAVLALQRAIAASPGNAALWTALGGALVMHDGGQMSPAALFAFKRAVQLAPRAPGPRFFLGMSLVQSGDLTAAKEAWRQALALTPPDAVYRFDIAERLMLIDQFIAMQQAQGQPR